MKSVQGASDQFVNQKLLVKISQNQSETPGFK